MIKNKRQEIESAIDGIFYHILAWHLDEGDYQPTEEEARKEVKRIIKNLIIKKIKL